MVRTLAYCSAGSMFTVACCYSTVIRGDNMLDSNDLQAIKQIVNEVVEQKRDPPELEVKLNDAQHEANFLSGQVCAKEKQLQRIHELLGTAEWLDEGQELVTITRKDYNKMLDILNGGIV